MLLFPRTLLVYWIDFTEFPVDGLAFAFSPLTY